MTILPLEIKMFKVEVVTLVPLYLMQVLSIKPQIKLAYLPTSPKALGCQILRPFSAIPLQNLLILMIQFESLVHRKLITTRLAYVVTGRRYKHPYLLFTTPQILDSALIRFLVVS